jgi:hypothetical protein
MDRTNQNTSWRICVSVFIGLALCTDLQASCLAVIVAARELIAYCLGNGSSFQSLMCLFLPGLSVSFFVLCVRIGLCDPESRSEYIISLFSSQKGFTAGTSRPYRWPLLLGPSGPYWTREGRTVFGAGNLFVYWMGLCGVLLISFGFKRRFFARGIHFLIGYMASFFPMFFARGELFLRDYLIPLMFAAACFGVGWDLWLPDHVKYGLVWLTAMIVLIGWFEWSPFVYGDILTVRGRTCRSWFKIWISGL